MIGINNLLHGFFKIYKAVFVSNFGIIVDKE